MMFLLVMYLLALAAILAFAVNSPFLRFSRAVVGVFVLLCAVLILTAQILSLFSAMNVTWAYVAVSFVITAAASIALRRLRIDRDLQVQEFSFPFGPRVKTYVAWFLATTGAAVVIGNILLVYGILPVVPDSVVYRFPRAYWYFGQGSLLHFTNHAEPRPLFYPFNGTLLYLPLLHFQLGPRSFSVPSLLSWMMIALTTYVFARNVGGPRIVAAATAWLVCLTPNILLQATSTNDEIIAGAILLAGLCFAHRWFLGRQLLDAVLAILGISISAGTKLHVMFYWPLLLAVGVLIAIYRRETLKEARSWLPARRLIVLAVTAAAAVVFSFSFIAYNYVSSGRLSAWEFNEQLLNKPFSWQAAVQTPILYISQVVLTPIADLHFATGSTERSQYYAAFNRLFAPLFGWVNNGPTFTSAFYRFTGVSSPSAVVFNEQTVFIGFTWLVAIMAAARVLWSHGCDRQKQWARVHVFALPVWALTFSATTRYIEGFTVYLGYGTIIAGPMLAYAFAPIGSRRLDQTRWVLLSFVAATHVFFACSILFTSSPRNLTVLMRAPSWPISRGFAVDSSVIDEIGRAKSGIVSHTIAWGQPHWVFMAYNPKIRQFMSWNPSPIVVPPEEPNDPTSIALRFSRYVLMPRMSEPRLHVYSFPQFTAYGHAVPIRIPDKATPGLTWLGDLLFALGPEWVFAAGNNVEARHAGRDKYIVQTFEEISDFGRDPEPIIRIHPMVYGLQPGDKLQFRFEMRIDGKLIGSTEWGGVPQAQFKATGIKGDNGTLTIYVRNDNAGGTIHSIEAPVRSTKALVLPRS